MANMETVASITWPDSKHTKVWRRRTDRALVFWTGLGKDFPAVADEYERDDGCANHVGIDFVELRLGLLESYDQHTADTDRDLLAEIDALLGTVRAAA